MLTMEEAEDLWREATWQSATADTQDLTAYTIEMGKKCYTFFLDDYTNEIEYIFDTITNHLVYAKNNGNDEEGDN